MQICSGLKNPGGTDSMPRLEDNVFIAAPPARFGTISQHGRKSRPVYWPLTADAEAKANAFGRGNRVYVLPRCRQGLRRPQPSGCGGLQRTLAKRLTFGIA